MTEVLLKVVSPESHWGQRLADLLADQPEVPSGKLGFPEAWRARPFWQANA